MGDSVVRVGIIDGGILEQIEDSRIKGKYHFFYEQNQISMDADTADRSGHGTAVFDIINKTQVTVEFYIIKIFDDFNAIEEDLLLNALEYTVNQLDLDILNLSLGVVRSTKIDELSELCSKLREKNTVVISAFDNAGAMSYPACLEQVIGVTSHPDCRKISDYVFYESDIVNIAAKGGLQKVRWYQPPYLIVEGNSFACAHVTRLAIELLNQGTTKEVLLAGMKKVSKRIITSRPAMKTQETLEFEMKKAVLFPFNKEMHSVVRFQELLRCEIVDVYDVRHSARVGASTNQLIHASEGKNYVIKDIRQITWDSFDTIILGHMEELTGLSNQTELREELLEQALTHGKNVFAFDTIERERYDRRDQLYCPVITEEHLEPVYQGKLYEISKPVVGVFGTSSKQGKYTLQLTLRKKLLEMGYQVGQVGTEPSALLFGMDAVFPFGYNNSVHLKEKEYVRYLNTTLNRISRKDCDIILVGSQSGTIPYGLNNLEYYTIGQYLFLLGTRPDVVILNVNSYDEMSYITNTISFIQSCIQAKVLAVVIFPLTIEDDWSGLYGKKRMVTDEEVAIFKQNIKKETGLESYLLSSEEDMNQLVNALVDYYAE